MYHNLTVGNAKHPIYTPVGDMAGEFVPVQDRKLGVVPTAPVQRQRWSRALLLSIALLRSNLTTALSSFRLYGEGPMDQRDQPVSIVWHKSSYSEAGSCVEVAHTATSILVRDSQDRLGAVLCIPQSIWVKFLADIRSDPPI